MTTSWGAAAPRERVSLTIEGDAFDVQSLEGREAVSEQFAYRIECHPSVEVPRADQLLGRAAAVTIGDRRGAERTIRGIVTEVSRTARDGGTVSLRLHVRPAAHLLTLGSNCRSFRDRSVVDIAREILGAAAQPLRFELAGTYLPRPYTVQYREDDWSFVSRLCAEEGIYAYFDHDAEQTTLVLADHSPSSADLEGGAHVPYVPASDLLAETEAVVALGTVGQLQPDRFSVRSFDPSRPTLELAASAGTDGSEHYDAPAAAPTSPEAVAARAALSKQAAVASAAGICGRTSSVRLTPGRTVTILGHPDSALQGSYFLTEVQCTVVQRRRGDTADRSAQPPYDCRFRAIPRDTPFRVSPLAPGASQPGLGSGVVVGAPGQEIHPDAAGRVRVVAHWDRSSPRSNEGGTWARVAQRGTAGSMLLPRVGWNVLTVQEEGDANAPRVLSRVHDADHPPSYPLPEAKTRLVFRTATSPSDGTSHEISLECQAGAEQILMNATRDLNVLVRHDKREVVARDLERVVAADHTLTVAAEHREAIGADQAHQCDADETITVGAGQSRVVEGHERVSIASNRSLSTGSTHATTVQGARTLRVGAALLDVSLGTITAQAGSVHAVMAGGSAAKLSTESIAESSQVSLQAVGGVKVETAKQGRTLAVKRTYSEMVGGAMVLRTSGGYSDEATIRSSWQVGALLRAKAPTVLVEADTRLDVICGATAITLLPSSVEITTPSLKLEGAGRIVVKSGTIRHN